MAKTQTLAAQSGALTQPLKLPAAFQASPDPIKARFIAPYITFAHPKRADEWAKLVAKFGQVLEGDMFLIRQDSLHKLDQAKLGWLCHKQYWAEVSAAGELQKASFKEMPKPFKEHIEAVVLVYLEDKEIVPANVQFRTTKCPAAKSMSDALMEASTAEWGERGPAHKESLVCAQPFMRFYGIVALGPQRVSKTSGLNYKPTVCQVRPTTLVEWRLLKEFTETEASQKMLEDAASRFEYRISEVKTKVVA